MNWRQWKAKRGGRPQKEARKGERYEDEALESVYGAGWDGIVGGP